MYLGIEKECRALLKFNWYPKMKELFEKRVLAYDSSELTDFDDQVAAYLNKLSSVHHFQRNL